MHHNAIKSTIYDFKTLGLYSNVALLYKRDQTIVQLTGEPTQCHEWLVHIKVFVGEWWTHSTHCDMGSYTIQESIEEKLELD